MLETLRRIVQKVSAAPDLPSALAITVNQIRDAMQVAACTIYLADEDNRELVLMATAGLNPQAVGRVRLDRRQGLVWSGWWLNARNRSIWRTHRAIHAFIRSAVLARMTITPCWVRR